MYTKSSMDPPTRRTLTWFASAVAIAGGGGGGRRSARLIPVLVGAGAAVVVGEDGVLSRRRRREPDDRRHGCNDEGSTAHLVDRSRAGDDCHPVGRTPCARLLGSAAVNGITVGFAIVAALAVFVIAATVVGREAHRLDAVAPRSVYIVDEAVEFVAEYLPESTQARLTPAELEQLLTSHMRWLHSKGLQPTNVVDRRQDIATPVVITEDTLAAYLLGEAERTGVQILADVDIVNVVDGHLAYFNVIGAIGPVADDADAGVA